jgi:glycosyltransferase involved in cell wall biosynthesis
VNTLVSICIPTYNGAKYIAECLESVCNQTFSNFEVVVCDDASTDNTVEIVKKYQRNDNRIKLFINQTNSGLSANWNKCMELATGEWIKFIFQDDSIHPHGIAELLKTSANAKVIVCEREFIFESGTSAKVIFNYNNLRRLYQFIPGNSTNYISSEDMCRLISKKFPHNFIGEPSSLFFSKECVSRYGGFLPNMTQMVDYEFILRLAVNEGLCYVPEKLISFRVHDSSTTHVNISINYFAFEFSDKIILSYRLLNDAVFSKFRQANSRTRLFFIFLYMYYLAAMALIFVRRNKQDAELQKKYTTLVATYKGIDKYSSFSVFFKVIDMLIRTRRVVRNYFVSKT